MHLFLYRFKESERMIDFHEIRIDFNKRGDPDYDSKDLNINQYSKNADKLSFNFEEESFQSVVFLQKEMMEKKAQR